MGNRRKSKAEKRKKKIRCRMCRGTDVEAKVYPQESKALYICRTCGYPWRSDIDV